MRRIVYFKATPGGAAQLAMETGVPLAIGTGFPFIGSLPLDPRIGIACDYSESLLHHYPASPAYVALQAITKRLQEDARIHTPLPSPSSCISASEGGSLAEFRLRTNF